MPRAHWLPSYPGNHELGAATNASHSLEALANHATLSPARSPMEIPAVQPHHHPAVGKASVVSLEVPHVLELALCHCRSQFQAPSQSDGKGSQATTNFHGASSPHSPTEMKTPENSAPEVPVSSQGRSSRSGGQHLSRLSL